jgi:hypothetical protein
MKTVIEGLVSKGTKSKKLKIYVIDGATCHDLALLLALKMSCENIPYPIETEG